MIRRASGFLSFLAAAALLIAALACSDSAPAPPTDAATRSEAPGGDADAGPPPAWIQAALAQPRGLLRHEEGTAPGYVLFSLLNGATTYLVDREGRVVQTWEREQAGTGGYLLDDGSLLRTVRLADPPNFKAGGVAGIVERLSWDGEVLWQWTLASHERILHHDLEPLPNGNLLLIGWELVTAEEALQAGRRAELVPEQGLWSEWLLEVEPVGRDDARIVWEWRLRDHLVQDHDASAENYGDPAAFPGRFDVNADHVRAGADEEELAQLQALGYVPADATQEDLRSDFLHLNSVDHHAGFDQLALSLPAIGEIWILDHSTTTEEARGSTGGRSGQGGEILYRWGNPRTYRRGDEADQRLFFQHQVEWVPDGWPGAGHLTVFDNGNERPDGEYSAVLEIAPPVTAAGRYPLPAKGPWPPAAPVWSYVAPDRESFFAPFISGAHRLPNGNTLICSGPQGRIFEVTPEGAVVWEYLNPFSGEAPGWSPPQAKQLPYALFRAAKLPPDHPGLAERELAPLEPQPAVFVPPPPPG
ncbi:MAG TPA: aryl-sulfate sulfotransferase [Thermoanaerobaculia bacterium]|nr:aryl-sulfate sulfotransferase [Thermoanaerobaculia bacterium]